jgi:hypothetical protein
MHFSNNFRILLLCCLILAISHSCQKKQEERQSLADKELNQIRSLLQEQKEAEQILTLQKRVESMLTNQALVSTSQQIKAYHTLAMLYCLLPDTAVLADEAVDKAISLSDQQLKNLFEGRSRFDPKTFAIYQLKQSIRSLKLLRAEIQIQLHQWEQALFWIDSYTRDQDADGILGRIQRLEDRKLQIMPFAQTTEISSGGRSVYQLEWDRVETELTELRKVLEYRSICLNGLKSVYRT